MSHQPRKSANSIMLQFTEQSEKAKNHSVQNVKSAIVAKPSCRDEKTEGMILEISKRFYFIFFMVLFFHILCLFFKYSCLHFHLAMLPTLFIPTSHPGTYTLCLCLCVFYTCSLMALPLSSLIIPFSPPFWLVSVCSLLQCLRLYFACRNQ